MAEKSKCDCVKPDVVILSTGLAINRFPHNVSVYLKTSDGPFTGEHIKLTKKFKESFTHLAQMDFLGPDM